MVGSYCWINEEDKKTNTNVGYVGEAEDEDISMVMVLMPAAEAGGWDEGWGSKGDWMVTQ